MRFTNYYYQLLYIILAGLILLARPAVAETGLLYRLEKPGIEDNYLFGTMHTEDVRVISIMDQLEQPLKESNTLVLEMLPDADALLRVAKTMMLPSGKTLKQVLGEEQYNQMIEAATGAGLPEVALMHLKPWAAAVMLSMPVSQSGAFLDLRLYQEAIESDKQLLGLESVHEQLAIFDELSMDQQLDFLRYAIKNLPDLPKQLEMLTQAYLDRDMDELLEISNQYQMSMTGDLDQWFEEHVITKRNKKMWRRLESALQEGKLFVAVGALHLAGESGLVQLARDSGYKITVIY